MGGGGDGSVPAWLTPRRGPIPRSVAHIKENSPFRAWQVPLLSHPSRPQTLRRASVPELRLAEVGGIGQGADALRASTVRGASEEEQKLFARMSAVFKDGVLPELNDEWRQVMCRQMGMPAHMLGEKPPRLDTLDRAKRCALVPPSTIQPTPLSRIFATAPGSVRASWTTAGSRSESERKLPERMEALCQPPSTASSGKSRTHRISDSAIRIARLSRPSARHISTKPFVRSLSPKEKKKKQEEMLKLADEPPATADAHATAVAPEPRIVDDEDPPFLWPDNLWYTPHTLQWQKNGGKPKPPPKASDKENFKFKFFWDKLSEDEHYLHSLTVNEAYRGRVKAQNLNEKELATAKMKAAQISYMWMRRQIKAEEHSVLQGKEDTKRELNEKQEERERVLAEERRVEREAQRREQLYRLTDKVFKALCTDPETGLPIDPRIIFRRLDTDGGGTVDIDEFRNGLHLCGCELTDDELQLIWEEIDGSDGESDGQVLHSPKYLTPCQCS